MNQKDFKKVKAKELNQLLDFLGATRLEIAQALGVGESSLRRWIRNKSFPLDIWGTLLSEDFQHDFRVIQASSPKKYRSPSDNDFIGFSEAKTNKEKGDVLYSLPPPGSSMEALMEASLEELVDVIAQRGWRVQLTRDE